MKKSKKIKEDIAQVIPIAEVTECGTSLRQSMHKQSLVNNLTPLQLNDDNIFQKHAIIESLVPEILHQLNQIDTCMENVRALIRPHTTRNRTCDGYPVFTQDFDVYKQFLDYQRAQLCQVLEQDLVFWTEKKQETNRVKSDLLKHMQLLEQQ